MALLSDRIFFILLNDNASSTRQMFNTFSQCIVIVKIVLYLFSSYEGFRRSYIIVLIYFEELNQAHFYDEKKKMN